MVTLFQRFFQKATAPRVKQQNLLLLHADTPGDSSPGRFMQQIFQDAKIDRLEHRVSCRPWPSLSSFTTVVILPGAVSDLQEEEVKRLRTFISGGGGLFTVFPEYTPQSAELFGLVETECSHPGCAEDFEERITFSPEIFPGIDSVSVLHPANHTGVGMDPTIKDTVAVLIEYRNGEPLVWQKEMGRGGLVVWNMEDAHDWKWRGIFLQCLLLSTPVTVLPVANAASIQVDDFPAGFADLESSILREEFDMRFVEFLDRIWLPDLLELGAELDIPFCCCIPFSYNAKTAPPFDFAEWEAVTRPCGNEEKPAPVCFAERLLSKHELALHGYNHLPLTLNDWPSETAMIAALEVVKNRWKSDNLGPEPASYIPPMNVYDKTGIRALAKAFPSIRVICGTPYGSFEEGAGREFGPEPWAPSLFCVPRWTYGYIQKPTDFLLMISQLSALGLWTHFIHADDILDTETEPGQKWEPRNGERRHWRTPERGGMLPAFRSWLTGVRKDFPWLRFMTAEDAAKSIQQHQSNKITVQFISSREIKITAKAASDLMVRVRKDYGPPQFSNLTLLHQDSLSSTILYTLRMQHCEAEILWNQ